MNSLELASKRWVETANEMSGAAKQENPGRAGAVMHIDDELREAIGKMQVDCQDFPLSAMGTFIGTVIRYGLHKDPDPEALARATLQCPRELQAGVAAACLLTHFICYKAWAEQPLRNMESIDKLMGAALSLQAKLGEDDEDLKVIVNEVCKL